MKQLRLSTHVDVWYIAKEKLISNYLMFKMASNLHSLFSIFCNFDIARLRATGFLTLRTYLLTDLTLIFREFSIWPGLVRVKILERSKHYFVSDSPENMIFGENMKLQIYMYSFLGFSLRIIKRPLVSYLELFVN